MLRPRPHSAKVHFDYSPVQLYSIDACGIQAECRYTYTPIGYHGVVDYGHVKEVTIARRFRGEENCLLEFNVTNR